MGPPGKAGALGEDLKPKPRHLCLPSQEESGCQLQREQTPSTASDGVSTSSSTSPVKQGTSAASLSTEAGFPSKEDVSAVPVPSGQWHVWAGSSQG